MDKPMNFLLYTSDDGKVNVQVIVDNDTETIWTTQKGMSELFDVNVSNISRHINNIFESGELDGKSNLRKMQIANSAVSFTCCTGTSARYNSISPTSSSH